MWISRYTLKPRRALSTHAGAGLREGALLRDGDGFADIHPWPELGDAPLDEQLTLLARGETTELTRRSLLLLASDAHARRRGVSLFEGLRIPESHWPGDDPPPAFDTAKVKFRSTLPPRVRLRLDFNGTLSAEQFERLAASWPRQRIDFVEDPCPYDPVLWQRLRERTGIRLALDRRIDPAVEVLVMKPAFQDVDAFLASRPEGGLPEVVVTSYMDHALGQMAAAWVAARNRERLSARCGLFTHVLFETDPFFERIAADGARLLPAAGTGFGFDDLLEAQPWVRLT